MESGFEVFEHGADVGVRGWGASLEEAFIQGARAMFSLMTEDLQSVNWETEIQIQTAGYDLESLFVAWLNALLTESDLQRLLLSGFEVSLVPWHISSVAKKNPPLAPPSRLEDRRQGGESEEERFRTDTGQCTYDSAPGQEYTLQGKAKGEPFSARREEQGVEVKGATFCLAEVFEREGRWVAQCVVDV